MHHHDFNRITGHEATLYDKGKAVRVVKIMDVPPHTSLETNERTYAAIAMTSVAAFEQSFSGKNHGDTYAIAIDIGNLRLLDEFDRILMWDRLRIHLDARGLGAFKVFFAKCDCIVIEGTVLPQSDGFAQ